MTTNIIYANIALGVCPHGVHQGQVAIYSTRRVYRDLSPWRHYSPTPKNIERFFVIKQAIEKAGGAL